MYITLEWLLERCKMYRYIYSVVMSVKNSKILVRIASVVSLRSREGPGSLREIMHRVVILYGYASNIFTRKTHQWVWYRSLVSILYWLSGALLYRIRPRNLT